MPKKPLLIAAMTVAVAAAYVAFPVRAADPDLDLQAVQAVCGRCHTTAVFLSQPRSWDRWNDVFADMTRRGANGTDEQLARILDSGDLGEFFDRWEQHPSLSSLLPFAADLRAERMSHRPAGPGGTRTLMSPWSPAAGFSTGL